ncbi:hypothetical protein MLD38_007556 [Melastoma candidum]|uniref:Uncharacterized protein n=1 Tax=Melastoma candidum TaxID=119954 RepID=A0ACB9RSU6_9MYRT|nr:hypothetical protein MLD38_007556 [Melastoma candidum]
MGKTINISGFPSNVSAAMVKEFLEGTTGQGTVFAIKVRKCKTGSRSFAIVQFLSVEDADRIILMAAQRMLYGSYYLTAHRVEQDIVPRPRVLVHSMQSKSLHFGCQVAADKFLSLWKGSDVSVSFGRGSRKLSFYLEHGFTEYKLELSYDNIWRIELHRSGFLSRNHLLIQLYGAPFIYKKAAPSSGNVGAVFAFGAPDGMT